MKLREGASAFLERESGRLLSCQARIPALVVHRLSDARFRLLIASKDLMQVSAALLARQRHRLELFQQRITDASLKEGKPVTDASLVSLGDEIITRLHHGELTSIVNSELLQSSNCKSSNRK